MTSKHKGIWWAIIMVLDLVTMFSHKVVIAILPKFWLQTFWCTTSELSEQFISISVSIVLHYRLWVSLNKTVAQYYFHNRSCSEMLRNDSNQYTLFYSSYAPPIKNILLVRLVWLNQCGTHYSFIINSLNNYKDTCK